MTRRVEVASSVYDTIEQRFGEERTPAGAPSGYDFIGGPLAAAVFAFRDFDELPYDPDYWNIIDRDPE